MLPVVKLKDLFEKASKEDLKNLENSIEESSTTINSNSSNYYADLSGAKENVEMEVYIILTEIKLSYIPKENMKAFVENVRNDFEMIFGDNHNVKVNLCEGVSKQDKTFFVDTIIKGVFNDFALQGKLESFKQGIQIQLQSMLYGIININKYPEGILVRVSVDSNFSINRRSFLEQNETKNNNEQEFDYEQRSLVYKPVDPAYSFDRVIIPEEVLVKIEESLNIVQYEQKVFEEWGLKAIQPNPSSALSFYGPSGTGKTMAAEAIAQKLGKKILKASYADIESKFHGEGPKMVKAIFMAAQREDAVLFIDEADSLLSKRLTNVSQGSEQAINSMRSQLLICLEEFKGIVIFATNLVVNYDHAFLTRLISIKFIRPDAECREKIWRVHLYPTDTQLSNEHKLNIPLDDDVDIKELAEKYDFCGREIRNVVISACVRTAMDDRNTVTQNDLISSCEKIKKEIEDIQNAKDHTVIPTEKVNLSDEQKNILKESLKNKLKSVEE